MEIQIKESATGIMITKTENLVTTVYIAKYPDGELVCLGCSRKKDVREMSNFINK